MLVSIVLPCYNPPDGWVENAVEKYRELSTLFGSDVQLILVQDGKDPHITHAHIDTFRKHIHLFRYVYYEENRGKGYAIRQGVAQAAGNIVIYTDIDFPYTVASIAKIHDAVKNRGIDLAIGVKDERYYEQVSPARRFVSRHLRWLTRNFLSLPVTDTQCGLKGFDEKMKPLFLQTTINRYLFDLEFIRMAHKKRYRLEAIPIVLHEGIQFRKLNYRVLIPELFNFMKLLFK